MAPPKANSFTTKKRPRAWQQVEDEPPEGAPPSEAFVKLQRELEEREKVERRNADRQATLDELIARTEGRSRKVGTLLYLDVELRKQTSTMAKLQSFVTTGRLIFEVFDDLLPRTADAMIRLVRATGAQATGAQADGRDKSSAASFRNATFSYVVPGFLCRGGTAVTEENASSRTAFHGTSEAKWDGLRLTCRGVIALASEKSNEFIISFKPLEDLDGQRMVFGRVCPASFELLDEIEAAGAPDGEPTKAIVIVGGGVIDPELVRAPACVRLLRPGVGYLYHLRFVYARRSFAGPRPPRSLSALLS
jgi:cyclophilin family peptidyl-prolyl cis-trans isomerase